MKTIRFKDFSATTIAVALIASLIPALTVLASTPKPAAAAGNDIIAPSSSNVWLEVAGSFAGDTEEFGMTSPSSYTVCTNCNSLGGSAAQNAGTVTAGAPIVLYLTDHSQGGTFASTDPNHAHIYPVTSSSWIIAWEDAVQDNNFTDLFTWVTVGPTYDTGQPAGGSIIPEEILGGMSPAEWCNCRMGNVADPVETTSGNFWRTFNDFSIPGRGPALSVSRTYNSYISNTHTGLFGYGWNSNYESSLTFSGSDVIVNQENGSQAKFTASGSVYTAPPRVTATLVHNGDGTYTFTRHATEIFNFDSSGQLISERDLNGYTTTITHPSSTSMVVTDEAGRTLNFTLSGGHVTQITDPASRSTSYSYDGSGNLTDAIDVGGGHWQFTYNSVHQMITMREPKYYGDTTTTPSPVVTNHYDGSGRVDSQTDQLGRTTTFAYVQPQAGVVPTYVRVTDPKGNTTQYSYMFGELIGTIKGWGSSQEASTTYSYDPQTTGLTSVKDPNGHETKYSYDASGNQTSITDALGHTTAMTYNALNNLTSTTDPTGVTTTLTYDANGNLLTQDRPLVTGSGTEHETTTYTYGDSSHPGDVTQLSDPLGRLTKMTYNTYGDVTSTIDGMDDKTTTSYNTPISIGWVISTVSPKGNVPGGTPSQYTTTYTRDAFGRATSMKDPLWTSGAAHQQATTYDANGNQTSATDGNSHTTTYTYDAANQLTSTARPDATTLGNQYWPDGSLKTQTDGASHTTNYAYDSRGYMTTVTDPLSRVTTYATDGVGNVTNKIDPSGTCGTTPVGCTTYTYDAANRLTGTTYSDGTTPSVAYVYDNAGRRTSMTDGTGTTGYVYDSLGRLTSQNKGTTQSVAYGYNKASQVNSITYPGGHTVSRTYDNAGRFNAVSDWLGHTNKFTYDPDSNQTSTAYGNGIASANTFDRAAEMTNISIAKGVTGNLTYTRDGGGQLASATTTGSIAQPAESYTYDQNNRLTNANSNTYAYDNSDNPTTLVGATQTFDNGNQITSRTVAGVPTTFGYDNKGNRTSAGSTTYAYDQGNRLKTYTSGATSATYAYDGDGLRDAKTTGATNKFAYDTAEGTAMVISDQSNFYIYGPGGVPVEQIDGSGNATYIHQDQLGSTRALTSQSKAVVGTYAFDAYGNTTSHTGSASTPLQYAGQYQDVESGLYWMRARYYDPSTAQFMNVDPLASMTRSVYGYVNNNPLNGTDPSGRWFGEGVYDDFMMGSVVVHDSIHGGEYSQDWNACINGNLVAAGTSLCENFNGIHPTSPMGTYSVGPGLGITGSVGLGQSSTSTVCGGGAVGLGAQRCYDYVTGESSWQLQVGGGAGISVTCADGANLNTFFERVVNPFVDGLSQSETARDALRKVGLM